MFAILIALVTRAAVQHFYRAMLRIRGTSHRPLSVCVRLSQVGVISKRLNESSWFSACELPSTPSYTVLKENSNSKGTSL